MMCVDNTLASRIRVMTMMNVGDGNCKGNYGAELNQILAGGPKINIL